MVHDNHSILLFAAYCPPPCICSAQSYYQVRRGTEMDIPALCSANLAPTLSECFKNLSVQFCTQVV